MVNLSSSQGVGDGQADMVIVNGTATNDLITLTGSTNGVNVVGLSASIFSMLLIVCINQEKMLLMPFQKAMSKE